MTQPDDEPRGLSAHLAEFVREPTLWPVLVAAVGIFATLGAAVLLAALRERSPFALVALALLLGMSADASIRELRGGGAGPIVVAIALLWTLSGAAAIAVVALGWY